MREEADDELEPRQGEDEEPDVLAELRVVGAERDAVAPEQERLPVARERGRGEPPRNDRDDDMATRRSGSMAWRYCSRLCWAGVEGM